MTDLISRLEALEGPSAELNGEIYMTVLREVLGGECDWDKQFAYFNERAPKYTQSIDAAMSLVPDLLRIVTITECQDGIEPKWFCKFGSRTENSNMPASGGPTPAIAICIAALRARDQS